MLKANIVKVDTSQYIRYFTAASSLMFLLMISSVLPVNFTFGQTAQQQFPQSIIVSSSIETTPHLLNLKSTQQGNTQPQRVVDLVLIRQTLLLPR